MTEREAGTVGRYMHRNLETLPGQISDEFPLDQYRHQSDDSRREKIMRGNRRTDWRQNRRPERLAPAGGVLLAPTQRSII